MFRDSYVIIHVHNEHSMYISYIHVWVCYKLMTYRFQRFHIWFHHNWNIFIYIVVVRTSLFLLNVITFSSRLMPFEKYKSSYSPQPGVKYYYYCSSIWMDLILDMIRHWTKKPNKPTCFILSVTFLSFPKHLKNAPFFSILKGYLIDYILKE